MYKTLRIVFCVLACICAAATIFIFVYFGWWGFAPLGGACAFAALMYACKNAQEREEHKVNTPEPARGDFITGKIDRKDD